MKCNNNKLKHNCGIKTPSRCVFYDLDLPEFSDVEKAKNFVNMLSTKAMELSMVQKSTSI